MAVTSNDVLQVALGCLKQQCEGGYRSCISRSYYAMFHHTLSCLQHVPHFSSNHHANLIGYMTNKAENKLEPFDSQKLKVLGYSLRQQRDARNESDYDLNDVSVSEDMAKLSFSTAQLYFDKWEELKSSKAS
ncbi:hypothetical protein [Pantoea ananatis]|uniref:hypothetical protein n=1 Tax=Pantoea ananas TaxID=553 RepID=UPI001B305EFC|nr:hypothetical protein [Pantoea ananatis]